MRALVLTPDFPPAPGGIQLVAHRIVRHWTRLEARVVTAAHPSAGRFDARQEIDVRRTPAPDLIGQRGAMLLLNAGSVLELLRAAPDVILSMHVVTAPAACIARRLRGIPFVQYGHANELARRPRLTRYAFARAAAGIVVSRHARALAEAAGADPAKLHVIPPGVDPPSQPRAERAPRPTVVTVSRMDGHYKGHDVLIGALSLLRQRVPDALWVAIGDGPLREEYEARVRAEGLDDHALFTGSLPDEERDAWLDRAWVFAMPSRVPPGGGGEGFGIVYLEAGAHRLPVVAGHSGGAVDAVFHGKTGLLVDPESEREVADALTALLTDHERAAAMGRKGEANARVFSWERAGSEVEDLLVELARA